MQEPADLDKKLRSSRIYFFAASYKGASRHLQQMLRAEALVRAHRFGRMKRGLVVVSPREQLEPILDQSHLIAEMAFSGFACQLAQYRTGRVGSVSEAFSFRLKRPLG
jgi:hypothetical protein